MNFCLAAELADFYYIYLHQSSTKSTKYHYYNLIYHENAFVYSIARHGGGTKSKPTPPIAFQYSIACFGGGAETGTITTDEPVPYPDLFHIPPERGHDFSDALV
jgi:hypothetical protein